MACSGKLVILFKPASSDEVAIELEMDSLGDMITRVETPQNFCAAFELADRYRISQNKKRIISASKDKQLKSFRFLVNKN